MSTPPQPTGPSTSGPAAPPSRAADLPASSGGEQARPAGTVAVLGAGTMGEAVLAGVLRSGWGTGDVVVCVRRPERATELEQRHGVPAVPVAEGATRDVVVVAVKPQQLDALLAEAAPHVRPGTLVVSVMAGVTTARLAAALPDGVDVVRAMPNTPALVGAGVTAVSAAQGTGEDRLALAEALLAGTGTVVRVPESAQDAVAGVSGSGPAYVFALVEAMVEGGVHAGLPRATATELAVSTALGAARLLAESGEHPALLRERVTSPAGTTAAALRQLEERGLRVAVLAAVEAAAGRSRELGGGGRPAA